MSAFARDQKRFVCEGIFLNGAMDACPPGKWPFLLNARSYVQGGLHARGGFVATPATALGGPVHTLWRLADSTPFATIPSRRFYGVGINIFSGPTAGPFPLLDTGYSGNPLSCLPIEPSGSPQPWLYVADSSRMRKFNVNGLSYPIGIASPVLPPDATLGDVGLIPIAIFDSGVLGWASVGTTATAIAHSPRIPNLGPVGPITISSILYDAGTSGNASVVPSSMADISDGMLLLFNSPPGPVSWLAEVAQITIAIAPTTVASIVYEVGTTGACVIQPVASLGTGQLDAPSPGDLSYAQLLHQSAAGTLPAGVTGVAVPRGTAGLSNPTPPDATRPVRRIRQPDFPVNSLVRLNGVETVRILSVATGPDGIQSFRCVTTTTIAAGQTITGIAAFRAFFANTGPGGPTAGMNIYDGAVTNTITPSLPSTGTATTGVATAGIISPVAAIDLSQVTVEGVVRPVLPDDLLHLAIKASDLTKVTTVRIYLDVDRLVNDFTQNYYFFEWRASDIIQAIQNTNTAVVGTLVSAASTAATVSAIQNAPVTPPSKYHGPTAPGPLAPTPESAALALGNNQWIDLRCRINDLVHVGTDTARTLRDVVRAEILVSVAGPATPVSVWYDTLHVSGGYGPDVGSLGNSYHYRQSYRSSATGAVSNPGPASRTGMNPRRQRVHLVGVQSPDPQVDLVDWWRIGGGLTTWTYDGTTLNAPPPVFEDVYGDQAIDGGKTLETDNFQPWPSTDLPRVGTCKVAGNLLQRLTGDFFNVLWAEGSQVIVNGRVYTLYGPPISASLAYLNENAGSSASAAFTVPSATLLSQVQPVLFGGPIGGVIFTFGCGDARNPGTLTWTKGNSPDTASDAATLQVTPASEPLQNGYLYDGVPFVFSTDEQYVIQPDFANPNQFRALITPCGRGLWARWAQAGTPYGQAFLAKDGIFLTAGGGVAKSLTDQDLYPLFPHGDQPGVTVNGIAPPNMANTTRLRLAFSDGWLYFDYVDLNGADHTLAFWFANNSWWFDGSSPGVTARWAEIGSLVHEALIGGNNGTVYTIGGITDDGTTISCQATKVENQSDARIQKLYEDLMVELDPGGSTTVTISLGLTNNTVTLAPVAQVVTAGRKPYYFNLNPTTMDAFGTNLQIGLAWSPLVVAPLPAPIFYVYEIRYQLTPELATNWLSGPTTHGLPGFQHVPLVLLCYRASTTVDFRVIIDGVTYTYTLPSTAGKYAKNFFRLQSVKGLTFQYGFLASAQAAFQLYDRDCEIFIQPWGFPGGYQRLKPFSGVTGLAESGVVGVRGA